MVERKANPLCEKWRKEALKNLKIVEALPLDSGVAYLVLQCVGDFVRAVSLDGCGIESGDKVNKSVLAIEKAMISRIALDVTNTLFTINLSALRNSNKRLVEFLPVYDRLASVVSGLVHWNSIHKIGAMSAIEVVTKEFEHIEVALNQLVRKKPDLEIDPVLRLRCNLNTNVFQMRSAAA